MKIKTQDLIGISLDWTVWVLADGAKAYPQLIGKTFIRAWNGNSSKYLHPSTDWAQGGPIIEREHICLDKFDNYNFIAFQRIDGDRTFIMTGPTQLVAAMRCLVRSKLGDEVDIPGELT